MLDCIIVGGGPAGSSAAYHLATLGAQSGSAHRVLILEKDSLPRYKPCTGAVSPSVADWFDFDFTPAIDCQSKRVCYSWKLGDTIDAQLETEPIWSVRREVFDQFLIDKAKAAGAEVRDNTAVTGVTFKGDYWEIRTEREVLTCRYAIAADGANGPMANWLGFRPHKLRDASVLELEVAAPVESGAFCFEFGLAKNGCVWSFPKRQGYSLGISSFIGSSIKKPDGLLKKYAGSIAGANGNAASQDIIKETIYTHPLKLWDGNHPLHTDCALLVGEAAAIVDPLTAEGIRPAMYSGMMAAKAIDRALSGEPEALADYSRTMHETWGADMQWAQRIASVFFRVPKIGYRVGIKRPTATKRLGQILAGEVSYADIANRVIKRISTGFIPGMRS